MTVIYTKIMRKKAIVAIILTFCLLAVTGILYVARGWARGTLIPGYVFYFYKSTIDGDFKTAFQPVNAQLSIYGLAFPQASAYRCFSGQGARFQGLSETVPCFERQGSSLMPTSSFIVYWQHDSPTLERSLLESGWKKEYNSRQSIAGIFSVPNYTETVGVNYVKEFGKVACTLSISYTATEPNPFTVNEACERDVTFFGGSEG